MGQGGTATSGRGLTGAQVAAALRVTAESQRQRYHDREASAPGDTTSAVRRTRSGFQSGYATVPVSAYTECRKHEVKVAADASSGEATVHVTEYAADAFCFIRQIEEVDEELFADEWTLPEEQLKMELGEGRSQALFLKSRNLEFMSKTIAEEEVDVLLGILQEYAKHITYNPSSMLMRFYMLLKVEVDKEVGFILCFNDVFGSATALNEKWDIKGRVPKPGKFEQFPKLIRHAYEPDPCLIDTPANNREEKTNDRGDSVVVVKEEDKHKIATSKDKELTRLFWLEKPTRDKVVQQLLDDYAFLRGVGLMDYSILIGVSYTDSKVSRTGKHYFVIKNMKARPCAGENDAPDAVELRPASPRARSRSPAAENAPASLSEFTGGVHSLCDQEIYYVGVIDMLTKYNGKKRAANFFKGFLWEDKTLSTIPPKAYEERIARYTKIAFPEVS